MSTVYGIVKQSKGEIEVSSEVGKGATFEVFLPRIQEAVSEGAKDLARPQALRGKETVLLAEDDENVQRLAKRVLEMQGYAVLEASTGAQALQICEQYRGPIHLILTDVVMPKMSGRELVERMKQMRPDIRILYMSGYTDDAIVRHGALNEGVAFLQKPFTPDDLLRKVREVLHH